MFEGHCKQNLTSPIPAVDTGCDNFHSFINTRHMALPVTCGCSCSSNRNAHFEGAHHTPLWCPSEQASLNIGGRELDHWNRRLVLKVSYAGCTGLSPLFLAQFKIVQKSIKTIFWCSRSSKGIALGTNRKPLYDFLTVNNSNLNPISHRFWDTAQLIS